MYKVYQDLPGGSTNGWIVHEIEFEGGIVVLHDVKNMMPRTHCADILYLSPVHGNIRVDAIDSECSGHILRYPPTSRHAADHTNASQNKVA